MKVCEPPGADAMSAGADFWWHTRVMKFSLQFGIGNGVYGNL